MVKVMGNYMHFFVFHKIYKQLLLNRVGKLLFNKSI